MTAVRIDVTADDIAKGERNTGRRCPIALAIARTLPRFDYICVDGMPGVILGATLKDAAEIEFPPDAGQFIMRFDDGEDVEPFSFDLDVPDELTVPQ